MPHSAQSLAFDSAGNLFVVDAGDVSGSAPALPTPSINSPSRECEASLPPEARWMKALHVSPFSQYRVANEEQEWIGRSIAIAPGAVSLNRPCFSDMTWKVYTKV